MPAPPPASVPTLVVSTDRRFWIERTVPGLAFTGVCVWVSVAESGFMRLLGGVGVALFGVLTLYGLRQLLRRGPRLIVSAEGVAAADLGIGTIPWTEIARVEPFGSADAPFIAVHVSRPGAYLGSMKWWPRLITRLLLAQGLPLFSVNLIGADRNAHDVARFAASRAAQADPHRPRWSLTP